MASGDGKSNPFGNGTSGAVGNSGGGDMPGIKDHKGPDRPQRMGPNADLHAASIPEGGRILKLDPKGDRGGMVDQTAEGGMKHKPFKLGSSDMPGENSQEAGSVGDVDNASE